MNINHARIIAAKAIESTNNVDVIAHLIDYLGNNTNDNIVDHLCTLIVDPNNAITHELQDIDNQKIIDIINNDMNNTLIKIITPMTISIDNLLMEVHVKGRCLRKGYFKNEDEAKIGYEWNAEDKPSQHHPLYHEYKYEFNRTFDFNYNIWK